MSSFSLSRRELLLGLGAIGLQAPLWGFGKAKPAPRPERVIVVGAGVSALAAVTTLKKHGIHEVILLEARDRVGGRIWTSRRWQQQPVDLGASWIHGRRRNPITRLAKEAEAPFQVTDEDNMMLFGPQGNELSALEEKELEKLGARVYQAIYQGTLDPKLSLEKALEAWKPKATAAEQKRLRFLLHMLVELEAAEDADKLSAGLYGFGKDFGGSDLFLSQGYDQVFAPLYQGLDLRLNQTVKRIHWNAGGISVETQEGELQADKLILTLPLGVLKQAEALQVDPGWPEAKQKAIRRLGMGCMNKVILRFPEAFWPKEVEAFFRMTPPPERWSNWLNLMAYNGEPLLLSFMVGEQGRRLEKQSDPAIQEEAMASLRKQFGRDIPEPTGIQVSRWASDPFSYGSYSCLPPGATQKDIRRLAQPIEDRVFFAGEATHWDYNSTVHGAWLSGVREAERILKG